MSSLAIEIEAVATSGGGRKLVPELEKGPQYYQCGSIAVQKGITDVALADLYVQFARTGVLKRLFHETDQPSTLCGFLNTYLKEEANVIGCYRENQDTLQWKLIGIGWVNTVVKMGKFTRAQVGEGFIRHTHPKDILLSAQLVIEMGFDVVKPDVMHGTTPAPNRVAVAFARKVGFQIAGELEAGTVWNGELCPVILSSLTRERWQQVRPWRKE